MAPPKSLAEPPVSVTFCSDRLPPGPSTSRIRTEFVPSIVAPFPFTTIWLVTTGSPFSPLSGVVSE